MEFEENYKIILSNIFNEEINLGKNPKRNNCTGALLGEHFETFKKNFIERLQRLNNYFQKDANQINSIKKTAIDIAQDSGYFWAGPYSELIALDYWIQFKDLTDIKFINKGKSDEFEISLYEDSLAKKIGKKEVDIDLSFTLHFTKVYMDIKAYKPTHYEITDRIIEIIKKTGNYSNILIGLENLNGGNFFEASKDLTNEIKSGAIITNIKSAIANKNKLYIHELSSGNKYRFRIEYPNEQGITTLITEDSIDPYYKAYNNKYKFLNYSNKLLISEPSLLVFVVNPWFNRELYEANDFSKRYYRAVTRRVFIELSQNQTKMNELFVDIENEELKVSDVAGKITGIIFIEDKSILEIDDNKLFNAYIYLNPRATNKILKRENFEILNWTHSAIKPCVIEDFIYDNY